MATRASDPGGGRKLRPLNSRVALYRAYFCAFLEPAASTVAPMASKASEPHNFVPASIAVLTLASVVVLLFSDIAPGLFPTWAHGALAPLPLVLIAVASLLFHFGRRSPPLEWCKALLAALAFLFWAASLSCRNAAIATVFDDVAIALFVLDAFLVVVKWPPTSGARALRSAGQESSQ